MENTGSEKQLNTEDLGPENKKVREPVFNVHKMPKGYKSGRFENTSLGVDKKSLSVLEEKNHQEKKHHSKKTGFLIVFFGLLVVVFLVYLVFSYIKTGSFALKMPSFSLSFLNEKSKNIEIKDDGLKDSGKPEKQLDDDFSEDSSSLIINFDDLSDDTFNEDEFDYIATDTEIVNIEDGGNPENIVMSNFFVDTDNDGLSDEEELIFLTSPINMDTDGDGYDDLIEILNLYNPAGPGDLLQNDSIENYKNLAFSYNVFYPKQFELKTLSDGTSAIFLINDQSFLQILVEKNENNKNIEDWYLSRFFESIDSSLVVNKSGWSGVYGTDFYSFYLTDDKRENIYSIVYNFPENTAAVYYNIFRMMINSFSLK